MIEFIGYAGAFILVIAYLLLITKWSKYFLIVDIISCSFLLTYSLFILDFIFVFVNLFILIFLLIKQFNGGIK